jgi:alpha-glucosidase (family GH31 glycosyl hydrolase)
VQDVIRETVFMRYSLIHYIYTSFCESSTTGVPMMRPMFIEFPYESILFDQSTQFMFGNDILVAPKLEEPENFGDDISVTAYLPTSTFWYNYATKMLENRISPVTQSYSSKE